MSAADCPLCAAHGFDDCTVDAMRVERDALRAVVQRAVEALDAEHQQDGFTYQPSCETCGVAFDWPCPSKRVADELRKALG